MSSGYLEAKAVREKQRRICIGQPKIPHEANEGKMGVRPALHVAWGIFEPWGIGEDSSILVVFRPECALMDAYQSHTLQTGQPLEGTDLPNVRREKVFDAEITSSLHLPGGQRRCAAG